MKLRKQTLYTGRARLVMIMGSVAVFGLLLALPGNAQAAAEPTVGLGTATTYAVLAATTVTNTGATTVSGDLGLNPGDDAAITGFPPGRVINGATHAAGPEALQAQADLTVAYLDAAGRTPFITVSKDLGGQTLAPGVYKAPSDLRLTGTVTLDAKNDPNAVFIFQAGRGPGHRVIQQGQPGQRRLVLQRLLAGHQLCNARKRLQLPRQHPGADQRQPCHPRDRRRQGPGSQRRRHPPGEHHQKVPMRSGTRHTCADGNPPRHPDRGGLYR